jgi:hypothetical protein
MLENGDCDTSIVEECINWMRLKINMPFGGPSHNTVSAFIS